MHSFTLARSWSQLSLSSKFLRPSLSCIHRRYISAFLSNEPAEPGTLDPRSLSPHDFRDISNQIVFRFPSTKRSDIHYERRKFDGKSIYIPFPDKTKGFLYYWTHPDLPPTSGQIRFRITKTQNPRDFDGGSDFCLPSGIPWHSTLAYLAGNKSYAGVCDVLVRDGLVSRGIIEQLRPFAKSMRLMPRQATVLTSPDEIFPICLPLLNTAVYVASPGGSKQLRRINISLKNNEEIYKFVEPGKQVFALVQFLYPKKYERKNWVPRLRIAHVYASDGPVTVWAWCKEFKQA
ncbi:hypothetical protein F5146DRAFT_1037730 [Armillaria mellea]|nr:hypothetical protein F5146DRAFT_1037730 [Armillaria mellea]